MMGQISLSFLHRKKIDKLLIAKKNFSDKMGMPGGNRRARGEGGGGGDFGGEDPCYELSRCNSYDFDTNATPGTTHGIVLSNTPYPMEKKELAIFYEKSPCNCPASVHIHSSFFIGIVLAFI